MSVNNKKIDAKIELFRKLIDKEMTPQVTTSLANDVANQIRKRTRLGKGLNGPLNNLSPNYVDQRREFDFNLSPATKPTKSNLTATGQMLDSISGSGSQARIEIEIKGNRNGELTGSRSRISNSEVAQFVAKAGRSFFGLTISERKKFTREIKTILLKSLKNVLGG